MLHIGENRLVDMSAAIEKAHGSGDWVSYPPLGGTKELRRAYLNWLKRRFGLAEIPSLSRFMIEPTPGSKNALAVLIMLAVKKAGSPAPSKIQVLLPNPGYPAYYHATEYCDAVTRLYDDLLACTDKPPPENTAAIVVCHPDNPTGRVYDPATLDQVFRWAHRHNITVIVDECYIDLYLGAPPASALNRLAIDALDCPSFAVLHTLSKRSAMPGLRHGFIIGDRNTVESYAKYNRNCGVASSYSSCDVAAMLWADDQHVSIARKKLNKNCVLVKEALDSVFEFTSPEAGLFLWLHVGDGERLCYDLWKHHGVKVMPGAYLARLDSHGNNPGVPYVRLSLGREENDFKYAIECIRKFNFLIKQKFPC